MGVSGDGGSRNSPKKQKGPGVHRDPTTGRDSPTHISILHIPLQLRKGKSIRFSDKDFPLRVQPLHHLQYRPWPLLPEASRHRGHGVDASLPRQGSVRPAEIVDHRLQAEHVGVVLRLLAIGVREAREPSHPLRMSRLARSTIEVETVPTSGLPMTRAFVALTQTGGEYRLSPSTWSGSPRQFLISCA